MKNLLGFGLILALWSPTWATLDSFSPNPATQPALTAKHKMPRPAPPASQPTKQECQSGHVVASSGPVAVSSLNPALTGLAMQALNAGQPGNPAAVNALDQAVTSLASADAQALAPYVRSGGGSTSDPPTLRGWFHQQAVDPDSTWPMELSAGIQTLKSEVAPALSLRIGNQRPWSFEFGGVPSHDTGGNFQTESQTVDTTVHTAHVQSFYELHAAGVYAIKAGNQSWIAPDIAVGASMMHVKSQVESFTPGPILINGTTFTEGIYQSASTTRNSWSPLLRLGVTLFPEHLFSLRGDVAYVGYANTVNAFGTTLDLGFSGVMYRMMLAVKL